MSMQSLRTILFRLHQWLGLNTCILLGIMFLTGTLLVFSTELETAFYAKTKSSELADGKPLTFGQVFDNVQAAYPDVRIATIVRTETGAMFGDRLQIATKWGEKALIWSDPGTGEILGASPLHGVRYMLLAFHDSLFTGKGIGQAIVSVLAISLLASILSGLIAYRRFWRALKTPPPRGRGPRPWWGGLHRFLAVWSLPFLLTVAVTGIYYLVATMGIIPTRGQPIPAAAEREAALPSGFDGAMLDRAVAAAREVAPNQKITAVVLPYARKQGISFFGPDGGAVVSFDTTRVVIDPQTMAVLATVSGGGFSPKDQAKHFFDALHHGDWAGNYSRAAWLIFGAMGTMLMFSGAMVFASRIARMPAAGSIELEPRCAGRRVWGGMAIAKWALIPVALVVAGIGIYRFGLQEPKWVTIPPDGNQAVHARLQVKGPVRAGDPMTLRLRIDKPGVENASISWAGAVPQDLALTVRDDKSVARFWRRAEPDAMTATVWIGDGSSAEAAALKWRLGRPIF